MPKCNNAKNLSASGGCNNKLKVCKVKKPLRLSVFAVKEFKIFVKLCVLCGEIELKVLKVYKVESKYLTFNSLIFSF